MSLSTNDAVRETYRLALEENLKRHLKTQAEFERYKSIALQAAGRIDAEKEAFRTAYQSRLEEARAVILREETARRLEHPKPDWAVETPPSPDKIDLLARNRVQADHEARIGAIRSDQADQYVELRRACKGREAQERGVARDNVRDAFNRTNQQSPFERGDWTPGRSGPSRT